MILAGRCNLAGRDDRDAREEVEVEVLGQPGNPATRIGADVLAQVDGMWLEARRLLHRITVGDDKPERHAETGQKLVQEARALRARREQPLVEDEERHDPVAVASGRGQSRVVVHTQIAGEEDDCRARHSCDSAGVRRRAGVGAAVASWAIPASVPANTSRCSGSSANQ